MVKVEDVIETLKNIEENYFMDKKKFGYLVVIGFEDEQGKKRFEMASNLTAKGCEVIGNYIKTIDPSLKD